MSKESDQTPRLLIAFLQNGSSPYDVIVVTGPPTVLVGVQGPSIEVGEIVIRKESAL